MRKLEDKLTSRKFWLAVASFVMLFIVYASGDAEKAEKVSSLIMAGATVIAYIVGEGMTDKAHVNDANSSALYTAMIKALTSSTFAGSNAEDKKDEANH